ncbi:MAG: PRC-barrel domain-containing protein [Acidimicrobiales bacterium]
MRFTETKKHKVVDVTTAEQVAQVDGLVVDPDQQAVVAVRLRKVKGTGTVVPWSDLKSFGPDAVTVEGTASFRDAADEHERRAVGLDILGVLVLTDQGRAVGRVDDVDFDPGTGMISSVITDGGEIPGANILGLGAHALVVTEPRES